MAVQRKSSDLARNRSSEQRNTQRLHAPECLERRELMAADLREVALEALDLEPVESDVVVASSTIQSVRASAALESLAAHAASADFAMTSTNDERASAEKSVAVGDAEWARLVDAAFAEGALAVDEDSEGVIQLQECAPCMQGDVASASIDDWRTIKRTNYRPELRTEFRQWGDSIGDSSAPDVDGIGQLTSRGEDGLEFRVERDLESPVIGWAPLAFTDFGAIDSTNSNELQSEAAVRSDYRPNVRSDLRHPGSDLASSLSSYVRCFAPHENWNEEVTPSSSPTSTSSCCGEEAPWTTSLPVM